MAAEDAQASYLGIGDKKVTLDVLKAYHEETASSGSPGSAEPEMVSGGNFFGWKIGKLMILHINELISNLDTSFNQSKTFRLTKSGSPIDDYNPKEALTSCVNVLDVNAQKFLPCKLDFMPTGEITIYNMSGEPFPTGWDLGIVDSIIYPIP